MKSFHLIVFAVLAAFLFLAGCIDSGKNTDSGVNLCTSIWVCGEWSTCSNGKETRSCTDSADCWQDNKPVEERSCASPSNPCAEISCPDKCEGTTLMENGVCSGGKCTYTAVENSGTCIYADSGLDFNTVLRFCEHSKLAREIDFFFSVQTLGSTSPEKGSAVWLVADNSEYNKPSYLIQRDYAQGGKLWSETQWSGIPYKGRIWTINDANFIEDVDYDLIYCPKATTGNSCPGSGGKILYSGNLIVDCREIA